ncbi:translocase of chloroplast 101, chloroplastic [Elaeis guineensis]|uniref:Translocase of chloroplast 159, chloroplastic isoform X2 n=1 Tax=Elaeis guineensis var. tenera TaxID=51953 RepID=A0A6I9QII9_ELAGV|nr:translocase of chloroplast 159, chloroplastic isoform X2 [Elaeis guineensis]
MDSKAPVPISAALGTPSPSPSAPISLLGSLPPIRAPLSSEENDTDSSLSSDAAEDDEYATASDPDEGAADPTAAPAAAVYKGATLTRTASMPVAQLTADDDAEEEVFEEGVGDEEEDADGSSAAARVFPPDQNPGLADEDAVVTGEGDKPLFKTQGNPKPAESSKGGVLGVERKHALPENQLENPIKYGDFAAELKYGDFAAEPTGSFGSDQQDEKLETGLEEVSSPSIEEAVRSKPAEAQPDVAMVEKDGVIDTAGAKENLERAEELKPEAPEPDAEEVKISTADGAGSKQNPERVSRPPAKPLEHESSESSVGVDDDEKREDLNGGSVAVNSELAQASAEKVDGGNHRDAIAAVGKVEKYDVLDKSSEPMHPKVAEDSDAKLSTENDGEAVSKSAYLNDETADENVVTESKQAANDSELEPNEPGPQLAADSGDLIAADEVNTLPILAEDSISREKTGESLLSSSVSDQEVKPSADGSQVADGKEYMEQNEEEEEEESMVSDGPARVAILESSETAKQIIRELEEGSSSSSIQSAFDSSRDYSCNIDRPVASNSDEEVDTDEEGDGKEIFDSAALAALLKAATGSSTDESAIISQDAGRNFSVDRPAGLGSSVSSLRPAPPHSSRTSIFSPSELAVAAEPDNDMTEEEKKLHEKVELIRVKFLRLVQRLGHSPEDAVAAQVLYRLTLAEGIRRGRQTSQAFSLENARKKAMQLEAEGKEDLDFSCNILVIGKTGVGKSATINSIFGVEKSQTNAFEPATAFVKEIVGTVDGVKIRIIDTPGLRASVMDQSSNRRILSSIKKHTKKCPPDIVLYVDRMDTQTRDLNDLPLLRTTTSIFGSSIWFNAIVALTHAASAPPDGPNGSPLSYEVFIAQRSHVIQQSIRQAAGDMRLMNPVALVENHPSCRRNREGQRVLPNGLSWRPQMLLLCYSSKILSEANSLLKLQDPSPGKLFGFRFRSPPLPYLLSSLLQSRAHPKLSTDQGGDNGDSDVDLDDLSDADQDEEEDEYDQLPPFKPLRKSQIAKLTKEQKRAYFDEYDYRVKLLQKKQWNEELRRLKELKKRGKVGQDAFGYGEMVEEYDQENAPASVPVPLPDMVLPPSFDCDSPTYRYRFLEPTSQLLARPVLDMHGWDHDCGYDGVSLEESLAVAGKFPAAVSVQVTKDKKEFSIHLDSSISAKHGENCSTLAGFDIQTVGKQLAYILRGETKFKNLKKNKTAAGMSITFLGETVATGVKIEDQLSIGKRVSLVASTGAIHSQGDMAYGANLEARLRDKDYPIGQVLSTLGLSLIRWRSDLALGANLQSQFSVGRNSKMAVRVGLNNKLSGQITVRTTTSEQLQIALLGILPVAVSILRSLRPGESYAY